MRQPLRAFTPVMFALLYSLAHVASAEAQTFKYLLQWGSAGGGNGQFSGPVGIAVDPTDNLFVVDQGHNRIQKFDTSGNFLLAFGDFGNGNGEFNQPSGIAADGAGHIAVVDRLNHRIQIFNASGVRTGGFGSFGSTNGLFSGPTGVAYDVNGTLYVTDTGNNRVEKFSSLGTYLGQWNPGFNAPKAIASDANGFIYVADVSVVRKFLPSGTLVATFPNTAVGLASDPDSNLYTVNSTNVRKLTSRGQFITQWGTAGSGNGQFNGAQSVALDGEGDIYVTESTNSRVQKFGPQVHIDVLTSQNPSYVGQSVVLQTNFTPPDATGTVGFYVNGTLLQNATISAGQASTTTTALPLGSDSLVARYSGDSNYGANWSSAYVQQVGSNPVFLNSTPNPSVIGQSVMLTAAVSPSDATGRVYFYFRTSLLDSAVISGGIASMNLTTLPLGYDSLHADYSGDGSHAPASGAVYIHVVNQIPTTTTLGSSPNPSNFGQPVSLSATVTPSAAPGKVYFYRGATLLDSANVVGGSAGIVTSLLPTGKDSLTASYSGSTNYLPSTSAIRIHDVVFTGTTVGLNSAPNPTVFGQTATLTATVSPSAAPGIVRFLRGAIVIDSAALSGGVAAINTTGLPVGVDSLKAVYTGDAHYVAATSSVVLQTVNIAPTSTALTTSPNPSGGGQVVTLTATVTATPPASGTTTGTVQFSSDAVPLGAPVALVAGVATLNTAGIPPGVHSIGAAYSGSASYSASAATPVSQTNYAPEGALPWYVQVGSGGSGPGQFSGPRAVAQDASGNLYVADTGNNRIQKFNPKGVFLTQWGSAGAGAGQFNAPGALAVDAGGAVYVCDTGNGRVQKFTAGGIQLATYAGFFTPTGITACANGDLYVTEAGANRVQRITSGGAFVSSWTSGFNTPAGIAADAAGNLYVADSGNNRIQKFSVTGTFLLAWGTAGSGVAQFSMPWGIGVDGPGNVYVTEVGNNRVQKFTATAAYLGQWGAAGSGNGQFQGPRGIAAQGAGSVYVADTQNSRVQQFLSIQHISKISDLGNDQGRSVRIVFRPNSLDGPGSDITPIVRYDLFRRIDAAAPAPPASRARLDAVAIAGWDQVATVGAYQDTIYNQVVPTLADSSVSGLHWSVFFIRAATANPGVYYDSPADSGYSVDNLAPSTPSPFTATFGAGTASLHWTVNTAPDLKEYHLFRGGSAAFVPGPGNLVAATPDTGYVDHFPSQQYYKLSAVDFNGNESGYALVQPSNLAGVDGGGLPRELTLSRAVPNPARGTARVAFALPRNAAVALDVLDVGGRVTRRIAAQSFEAGRHEATWDLRDSRGAPVNSGIYFFRLRSAAETRTTRIVVVR